MINRKTCWPCIAVGLGMFIFGLDAVASSGDPGFNTRDVLLLVGGLLLSVIGAYAKGVERGVGKLEDRHDKLADERPLNDKITSAIRSARELTDHRLREVERQIQGIHRRLDFMHIPKASGPEQD